MIAHTAQAVGAPCPTLVLDAGQLPAREAELRLALGWIRQWLAATGSAHVLKFALVTASEHPMFDLDYRFVQCLPGEDEGDDRFDFDGNCGHSVLAAVVVAEQQGLLPRLAPGGRARVRVLNSGASVVCSMVCSVVGELDSVPRHDFTVHFVQSPSARLRELLPTGRAVERLGDGPEASLVELGNPYVFLDAAALGLAGEEQLFGAGEEVFARLLAIRAAAARRLGLPPDGSLPKIAAVGAFEPGRLHVRAVSVPSWHPTLAITGATCLAAAVAIPGTVPQRLAELVGVAAPRVPVVTPGGATEVTVAVRPSPEGDLLEWASVGHKLAHLTGPADLGPGAGIWRPHATAGTRLR